MMSGLPPPGGGNKTVQMVDTNSIVKTEANLPLQTTTSQVIQVGHHFYFVFILRQVRGNNTCLAG